MAPVHHQLHLKALSTQFPHFGPFSSSKGPNPFSLQGLHSVVFPLPGIPPSSPPLQWRFFPTHSVSGQVPPETSQSPFQTLHRKKDLFLLFSRREHPVVFFPIKYQGLLLCMCVVYFLDAWSSCWILNFMRTEILSVLFIPVS